MRDVAERLCSNGARASAKRLSRTRAPGGAQLSGKVLWIQSQHGLICGQGARGIPLFLEHFCQAKLRILIARIERGRSFKRGPGFLVAAYPHQLLGEEKRWACGF